MHLKLQTDIHGNYSQLDSQSLVDLYNTDLKMLLIEPIMYLIIAIAEEYEIEPVIYEGMDQDIAEEEDFDTAIAEKNTEEKIKRPTAQNVPSSLLARVKDLPSEEELGAGE